MNGFYLKDLAKIWSPAVIEQLVIFMKFENCHDTDNGVFYEFKNVRNFCFMMELDSVDMGLMEWID